MVDAEANILLRLYDMPQEGMEASTEKLANHISEKAYLSCKGMKLTTRLNTKDVAVMETTGPTNPKTDWYSSKESSIGIQLNGWIGSYNDFTMFANIVFHMAEGYARPVLQYTFRTVDGLLITGKMNRNREQPPKEEEYEEQ